MNHNPSRWHKILLELVPIIILMVAGFLAWFVFRKAVPAKPRTHSILVESRFPPPVSREQHFHQQAWELAQPHLTWAEAQGKSLIEEHQGGLDPFFDKAREDLPAFAGAVLGWPSKWRAVADHVPLVGSKGTHLDFLQDCFSKHLFTSETLDQEIHQTLSRFSKDMEGLENQMLVRLRKDLDGLGQMQKLHPMNSAAFQMVFQEALAQAARASVIEVRSEVARQVVSFLAGEALAQLAVRLGVSSAILGAGASSSVMTLGTGLVLGIAVDQVVNWTWNRIANPRQEMVKAMTLWLEDLHRQILDGTENFLGLRRTMEDFARQRQEVRRQVLRQLIFPEGSR